MHIRSIQNLILKQQKERKILPLGGAVDLNLLEEGRIYGLFFLNYFINFFDLLQGQILKKNCHPNPLLFLDLLKDLRPHTSDSSSFNIDLLVRKIVGQAMKEISSFTVPNCCQIDLNFGHDRVRARMKYRGLRKKFEM